MAKERRTVLIYIIGDDNTATKISGDDAFVWEKIMADAIRNLQQHEPEKYHLLTKIKPEKVQLMIRRVTAQEFKNIKAREHEDQE